MGPKGQLLRRSLDTSRLEGPCLLCSIWRGRRGKPGPGLVAAGLPAGGEAAGAAISTPAPGRASAPPGPRGRIPSRTACCAGTEPWHGYGSAGPSRSPPDPMPVARALGEVPESKHHGGPPPPAPGCDQYPPVWASFLVLWSLLFIFWLCPVAWGNLCSPTGMEPVPPVLGVWSLNPWTTREVPF